jgi:hypothetical protein
LIDYVPDILRNFCLGKLLSHLKHP